MCVMIWMVIDSAAQGCGGRIDGKGSQTGQTWWVTNLQTERQQHKQQGEDERKKKENTMNVETVVMKSLNRDWHSAGE